MGRVSAVRADMPGRALQRSRAATYLRVLWTLAGPLLFGCSNGPTAPAGTPAGTGEASGATAVDGSSSSGGASAVSGSSGAPEKGGCLSSGSGQDPPTPGSSRCGGRAG